jgi:four helix bundle protein
MWRCVVSISPNIAEGFSRQSYKERVQFYSTVQRSVTELQNQIVIAKDVDYIMSDKQGFAVNQSITVYKLLGGIIKKSKEIHNF